MEVERDDDHELINTLEIPLCGAASMVQHEVQKWSRPSPGWIKLNTDAAVDQQRGVACSGIVARDETGAFVAAECRRYDHLVEPAVIELLACRDVMMFARQQAWQNMEVEMDCQVVVCAWDRTVDDRSLCGQIIREMKSWVSSFQGFRLCFSKRAANRAAHCCARAVLSFDTSHVYFANIPGFLIEPVQSDLLSSME